MVKTRSSHASQPSPHPPQPRRQTVKKVKNKVTSPPARAKQKVRNNVGSPAARASRAVVAKAELARQRESAVYSSDEYNLSDEDDDDVEEEVALTVPLPPSLVVAAPLKSPAAALKPPPPASHSAAASVASSTGSSTREALDKDLVTSLVLDVHSIAGGFDAVTAKGPIQLTTILNQDPRLYGFRGDNIRRRINAKFERLKKKKRELPQEFFEWYQKQLTKPRLPNKSTPADLLKATPATPLSPSPILVPTLASPRATSVPTAVEFPSSLSSQPLPSLSSPPVQSSAPKPPPPPAASHHASKMSNSENTCKLRPEVRTLVPSLLSTTTNPMSLSCHVSFFAQG